MLVVSQHHGTYVLETLRRWHVHGVFDPASEDSRGLEHALRTLHAGQSYWTAALLAQVVNRNRSLHRLLSAAQQAILAGIGDGSDDKTVAQWFGRATSSMHDQRRTIHSKLRIHYRGELVQYAAKHGFVRFARGRVVRPGFQQLLAAYAASSAGRKRGPKTTTASKAEAAA